MGIPYAEVIGDPIAHSKSPLIHKFWLAKLGIEGDYRACRVRADKLQGYFAQRRRDPEWRGCNVTIPHKVPSLEWLDRLESSAAKIGAINCVTAGASGLLGSNTDINGVQAGIRKYPWADACLFGNGGAARAALWYLSTANKEAFLSRHRRCDTFIVARDTEKSSELLKEFELPGAAYSFSDAAKALAGVVLVINATSLGMAGQPSLPEHVLESLKLAYSDATVFDMVYNPVETQLVREAKRNGLHVVDGLTMLIGQADRAFQLFFGARAPREHDPELRELLTR
jgi:shikimate dehydrogenase